MTDGGHPRIADDRRTHAVLVRSRPGQWPFRENVAQWPAARWSSIRDLSSLLPTYPGLVAGAIRIRLGSEPAGLTPGNGPASLSRIILVIPTFS